jgi:hypothetical protein
MLSEKTRKYIYSFLLKDYAGQIDDMGSEEIARYGFTGVEELDDQGLVDEMENRQPNLEDSKEEYELLERAKAEMAVHELLTTPYVSLPTISPDETNLSLEVDGSTSSDGETTVGIGIKVEF